MRQTQPVPNRNHAATARARLRPPRRSRGAWITILILPGILLGQGIPSEAGLWQDYKSLFDRRTEQAREWDIWGNTFLPPAGMWMAQYKFNTIRANTRFGEDGKEGPILAPLEVLGGKLDFGPSGSAQAHKLAVILGLGKRWGVGVEMQVGTFDLQFDVNYDPPTDPLIDLAARTLISRRYGIEPFTESLEGLWQTIELLGHPRPVLEQKDNGLKVGDVSFAVGYNYLRTKHFSCLAALKFSFPTGHIADENAGLVFALGPDIDVGVGSFGFELGHLMDYRPPKPFDWIIFMTEVYYSFYADHTRKSPTVFTKPNEEVLALLNLFGTDLGPYFPDLSQMEPEYTYRPGSKVRGVFQVAPTLFGLIPLTFGVSGTYTNASEITTSTPAFVEYIDAIGLLADSWLVDSWAKVTLGLFPLRIPVSLAVGFNYPLAGKNALIYKDNWEFTFQFYSPWFFGEQLPPRFKKKDQQAE